MGCEHAAAGGGGRPGYLPETGKLYLVATYVYDPFNRRTMSVLVGTETQFHTYDGWRQAGQYTMEGPTSVAPTKQFVWGAELDELVAYRRRVGTSPSYTWENYFIVPGGQDTAAKLVDSSGNLVETYEYDPYGKASVYPAGNTTAVGYSTKGLPFLWKGIRLDDVTGLLYMRNRYYSTELGRFLTSDPIGVWGDRNNCGQEYGYVAESPLSLGDQYGLQGGLFGSVFGFLGTVVGGAVGVVASPIGGAVALAKGENVIAGMGGTIAGAANVGAGALGAVGSGVDGAGSTLVAAVANVGVGAVTLDLAQTAYGLNSVVCLPITVPASFIGGIAGGKPSIGEIRGPWGDCWTAVLAWNHATFWGLSLPGCVLLSHKHDAWLRSHEGGHTWQIIAFTGPGYLLLGIVDIAISGGNGTQSILDPIRMQGWTVVP